MGIFISSLHDVEVFTKIIFQWKNTMNKSCLIAVILALSFFPSTGFANAAKDSSAAESIFTKIFKAVENNDFSNFIADGDNQFKNAITIQLFDGLSALIAPRMKKGYMVIPLGVLNQQGCQMYLKKLVFKDGGDDLLAKFALRDGKVAGFWFL